MVTYSDQPTPRRIWNTRLVQGGLQIQIEVVATFLAIFRVHMNILSIIKVKIHMLIIVYKEQVVIPLHRMLLVSK